MQAINLPNICTALRMVLVVPMMALLLHKQFLFACAIFVVACLLDWLDGWLARSLQKTSAAGAVLDHLADKLLVDSTMIGLLYVVPGPAVFIAALVVISRDLAMAGLREYWLSMRLAQRGQVNLFGKWKTAVQMVSIAIVLAVLGLPGGHMMWLVDLGYLLVIVVTLLSLVGYLRSADLVNADNIHNR